MSRYPGQHHPCVRRCGSAFGLLLLGLVPRTGHTARDLDWAAVARIAEERYKDLGTKACTASTPLPERPQLAADNLRVASFFDFAARNLPENMSSRMRAGKLYSLFTRGVASYVRAHECAPGHEHGDVLAAALALIDFATVDLDLHPGDDKEAALTEYKDLRDAVQAKMRAAPRTPDSCPSCSSCEGPTPIEARRGCSVAGDGSGGWPGALLLLLGVARVRKRRRSCSRAPGAGGTFSGRGSFTETLVWISGKRSSVNRR